MPLYTNTYFLSACIESLPFSFIHVANRDWPKIVLLTNTLHLLLSPSGIYPLSTFLLLMFYKFIYVIFYNFALHWNPILITSKNIRSDCNIVWSKTNTWKLKKCWFPFKIDLSNIPLWFAIILISLDIRHKFRQNTIETSNFFWIFL